MRTDGPARDLLIGWSLLPFLTPNRFRLLLEHFDPLGEVAAAPDKLLEGLLAIAPEQAQTVRSPLHALAPTELDSLRRSTLTLFDDGYPPLLREIIDPPPALHYRGDVALLRKPAVAIVGSRRASPYAINVAQHLARSLVSAGLAIVSGLARGVDAAAHTAALEAGGATIAVLGTGIDIVYPKSNLRLHRSIEEHGLVLSEFGPGTPPLPPHFPIRNRVISGLTSGTVVIEATGRSGSLITARTAAEQGREVFAVPGSIFSAGSEGTHRLIQYGAKLVHDANDILEELGIDLRLPRVQPELPEEPLREVLAVLSREEAIHVDVAAARLERAVPSIAESLLQLELGGWVKAMPGSRYVRIK